MMNMYYSDMSASDRKVFEDELQEIETKLKELKNE